MLARIFAAVSIGLLGAAASHAQDSIMQGLSKSLAGSEALQGSGTFELRDGESIDLGDRNVTLSFSPGSLDQFGPGSLVIGISGFTQGVKPGDKLDLKRALVGHLYQDKPSCMLDVTGLVAPKGAAPVATFKFDCGGLVATAIEVSADAPEVASTSPPAAFAPVTDGVVKLATGQAVPILPENPQGPQLGLLGVQASRRGGPGIQAVFDIAGQRINASAGDRLDLARFGRRGNEELAAKEQCFADIIDVGSDGGTVIRLFCL